MARPDHIKRRLVYNHKRKRAYESRHEAKEAAKQLRAKIGEMIIFYMCPVKFNQKPHWHIGHPNLMEYRNRNQFEDKLRTMRNQISALNERVNKLEREND